MIERLDNKNLFYIFMLLVWSVAIVYINDWYFSVLVVNTVGIVLIINVSEYLFDVGDLLLLIAMIGFAIGFDFFQKDNKFIVSFLFVIACLSSYQFGKIIARRGGLRLAFLCVVIFSFVMYIKGLFYSLYYYGIGFVNIISDFWFQNERLWYSGGRPSAFYYIIPVSIVPFWLLYLKKNIILSAICLFMGLQLVVIEVMHGGRMTLLACIVFTILLFILLLIEHRKNIVVSVVFKCIIGVIAVLLVLVFVFIFLKWNTIVWYYNNSFWHRDGGIIHNVRFKWAFEQFVAVLKNPFGKSEIFFDGLPGERYYSHNGWTDIGRESGLIPMLSMISFSVINLYNCIVVLMKHKESEKYVILLAFLGMSMFSFLECITVAISFWWGAELFLGGIVNGLCAEQKNMRIFEVNVDSKVLFAIIGVGYLFIPLSYITTDYFVHRNAYVLMNCIYGLMIFIAVLFRRKSEGN